MRPSMESVPRSCFSPFAIGSCPGLSLQRVRFSPRFGSPLSPARSKFAIEHSSQKNWAAAASVCCILLAVLNIHEFPKPLTMQSDQLGASSLPVAAAIGDKPSSYLLSTWGHDEATMKYSYDRCDLLACCANNYTVSRRGDFFDHCSWKHSQSKHFLNGSSV